MRIMRFFDSYIIALCTIVFVITVIVLFPKATYANAGNLHHKKIDKKVVHSCGPLSLVTALSLLGHSVDASECAELAGSDDNGVTTLAGLQNAAKALGKHTKGMHLTPDELALINRPAILHVSLPSERNHFVVFAPSKGASFDLINPIRSEEKESYTAEQLRLMWEGDCLVFTSMPALTSIKIGIWRARGIIVAFGGLVSGILLAALLTSKLSRCCRFPLGIHLTAAQQWLAVMGLSLLAVIMSGVAVFSIRTIMNHRHHPINPQLVLGTTTLNLGNINLGHPLETSIWLGNRGQSPLKIDKKKIKTSCNCLSVSISKSELSSGDKEYLQIRLNPPHRLGPFKYSVLIPSNDPEESKKVLIIKGQVTGPGGVAYPPRLYFGRICDTEGALRSLVYFARRPEINVLNVTSDLPFVTCNFQPYSRVFKVNVLLTELPEPGPFEGTIKIITNDPKPDYREIVVPFYGIIERQVRNRFSN